MTACLDRLQHWLREQHVAFTVQHHREALTMQEVALEVHEAGAHVAKVVIGQADGQLVMLVVPTPEHVDFMRVAKLLNAHSASAADENEFKSRFPDCEVGAMPPFGVLYNMPTYLDEALARTSKLVFQAGTHRETLKLATEDFVRLAKPIIGRLIVEHAKEKAAAA
jgi:Ala-tRNA(Pro) deacylase